MPEQYCRERRAFTTNGVETTGYAHGKNKPKYLPPIMQKMLSEMGHKPKRKSYCKCNKAFKRKHTSL